jgi:hypothetical protein
MKRLKIFALVAGLTLASSVALAQAGAPQRPAAPSPPKPPAGLQPSSPGVAMLQEMPDARETRNRLNEIFEQLPPSVREVLRIDPTLLYRADYIANYPVLAAFLEQHPEVAHNPAFFIGERQFDERISTPSGRAFDSLNRAIENLAMILVIATITGGILFLARTIIEHRRWHRALRAQSELQTKLIDRFSSSDDLIAYLQSPAGRTLTEAPAIPQATPRPMGAPLSRIFWSLQAGIVGVALGAGVIVVSRGIATSEFADVLYGVGIIVLMIGVGFGVSAAVSYFLSQRLGLVRPLASPFGGEAPGS